MHDKNSQQTKNRREFPQLDKVYVQKKTLIADIILNIEKLDAYLLRSGPRQEFSSHHAYLTL